LPPWVAKEKIGTLLLASEMPVPIPRLSTVMLEEAKHSLTLGGAGEAGGGDSPHNCYSMHSVSKTCETSTRLGMVALTVGPVHTQASMRWESRQRERMRAHRRYSMHWVLETALGEPFVTSVTLPHLPPFPAVYLTTRNSDLTRGQVTAHPKSRGHLITAYLRPDAEEVGRGEEN